MPGGQLSLEAMWSGDGGDDEPLRTARDGALGAVPAAPVQPDGEPNSYFSELGNRIQDEIEDLAGDDPPGEEYLAKVGRLHAARMQAEDQILRQQVLLPAEPGTEMDETEPEPTTPSDGWTPIRAEQAELDGTR